jgi:hypothetical protein
MRRSWTVHALAPLAVLLPLASGCAYVTAVPAPPGSKVSGIRIYDVKPILIVNGQAADIRLVPNYNRAYALQFGAFLAKNDFQAKFDQGFVSEVHANMDSTEFIKFLSDLLKTIEPANALSGPADKQPNGGLENRFQVYDIVFDDDGNLHSLRPLIKKHELLDVETTKVTQFVVAAPELAGQTQGPGLPK